ncbi:transporter substrate-binding domain-containing protein [Streptosporangium sp. NPDC001559]|uniref:transporter substrate-binding domain-containing protein n=1 Tax=Streptosporangium sp. NPDC001559 TaxID=3366187 RepID=UPI0036EE8144
MRGLTALLTALACLPAAACSEAGGGDTLERVRAAGVLRVALTETNPPWNFLDEGGRPAGYDVDVAREVARRLGVSRVEFVGTDFANLVGGVVADRFDIVVAGQTATAERGRQVAFSRPYAVNRIAVFVRKGDTSITGPGDLAGRRIAVSEGTIQADFARTRVPGAEVRTYRNAILGLTDLAYGRADAALVSWFQGVYLATRNGLAVTAAGPPLRVCALSMSFDRHSPALLRAVDGAVGDMIGDGTLTTISRRRLGGLDMAAELRGTPAGRTG